MSLEVVLLTSATALLGDLMIALAKKSPPYLFAPYVRLWKESSLLHSMLHAERFSNWKPQAARYVALRAIKAQGADQEPPEPVLDLLESFLKQSKPVVLLGEPGAGKTTALEALTYRLAKRALLYNRLIWLALLVVNAALALAAPLFTFFWLASYILWEPLVRRFTAPLFVEARSDYSGGDVNEWCETAIRNRFGAKPPLGSRRRVALLIDGVNEVQGVLYGGFVEGWRGRLRSKPAPRVIFAGRGGEENPATRLGLERVFTICDLDDQGVEQFLKVYGREKASQEKKPYLVEQAKRDFDQLQKKNLLGEGGVGRNPYWLRMIVESGLYTVNRGALFRSFAEKLIRREIEEKPEERKHKPEWTTVPVEIEMEALATVALAMHDEKRIGFSDDAGFARARAAIRDSLGDLRYSVDDILGEAQAATLLRVQFKRRVEFAHQLVQEFFAAYALRSESRWREAVTHCEDLWWWQTLIHLGGLVATESSTDAYCDFVREALGDGSNEQRVFVAIGLLRSVENAPPELSNLVIGAFGELMERNLVLREGAATLNLTGRHRRAMDELTRILGEETAEAFATLLGDQRHVIQTVGILVLSIIATRRAAELLIGKLCGSRSDSTGSSIDEFVGIAPLVQIGAAAVEPLIASLRDESADTRSCAAKALGGIGDTRAIDSLVWALRDEDESVRLASVSALAELGSASVGSLIPVLRDKDANAAEHAATALGLIGDERAVGPLIAALQGGPLSVFRSVGVALARIGEPSVSKLIAALHDADSHQRLQIADVLRQIGAPAAEALIAALREQVINLRLAEYSGLRVPTVDDLERRLARSAGERWLREKCINLTTALEAISELAVAPLIAALRDNETGMRWRAAQILGRSGDARAVDPLIDSLRDKDESVRGSAADALGYLGDVRAAAALSVARMDAVPSVRSSAEKALRQLSATPVKAVIAALADSEGKAADTFIQAMLSVGPVGVEEFVAALKHARPEIRSRAGDVFRQIGGPSVETLVALAKKDSSVDLDWVAAMLKEIGASSVEPVIAVLEDSR